MKLYQIYSFIFVVAIGVLILIMIYNTARKLKKRKSPLSNKLGGPRVQKTFRKGSEIHYYNVAKNEPREIKPISDDNRYTLPTGLGFSKLKRKNTNKH
ncbi:hypothetical protein [Priestia megaterium]|uniref:Uncharacterized protein n=1 Tax=Priestia megaterium TaxID=1404 RepID=A0A6M6E4G0_PRIMG|nr:hypothetical protein [Priestia megaterium]QJX80059.1 hypothetical protein FDZ14_28595 [Priestia megaterium]